MKDTSVGGVWQIVDLVHDEQICKVPPEKLDNPQYEWEVDMGCVLEANLLNPKLVKRKVVRENNNDMKSVTLGHYACVFLATPLVCNCRCNILAVYDINTVSQSFVADVYFDVSIRGISADYYPEYVEELITKIYNLRESSLTLLNSIDTKSLSTWKDYSITPSRSAFRINKAYDYCFKFRCNACFFQEMELHHFPFDEQQLSIHLSINEPSDRVLMMYP